MFAKCKMAMAFCIKFYCAWLNVVGSQCDSKALV